MRKVGVRTINILENDFNNKYCRPFEERKKLSTRKYLLSRSIVNKAYGRSVTYGKFLLTNWCNIDKTAAFTVRSLSTSLYLCVLFPE